jgi:hypothetical protein
MNGERKVWYLCMSATRQASLIPPPSTPTLQLWTSQYLMPPSPIDPAISCKPWHGIYKYHTFLSSSYFILHIEPLKMDLTEGSETSAKLKSDAGEIPKRTYTIFCFVCFLVPFTELFRHTLYTLYGLVDCRRAWRNGRQSTET